MKKEKYSLLAVRSERELNIGDYIQALASSQFLPSVDQFIEREGLKTYSGDKVNMIMNGWYMHHPENWPPSPLINPLFVAFHINSKAKHRMLEADSLKYLKQHEPIGCRDTNTMQLLQNKGINAYFSGCMTLTLGYKYHSDEKSDKVYFVDPYFKTDWNILSLVGNSIYLILHFSSLHKIAIKYPGGKNILRKMLILTSFYREYSKFFTKETLLDAEYINQQSSIIKDQGKYDKDYLQFAEELVRKYAKAKLVVTSRIHCALPCLGLETPVIYTEDGNQSEASACRFGGLRELFNVMTWDKGQLVAEFDFDKKLSSSYTIKNKERWKELSTNLKERCSNWINMNNKQ